ncbi:hypothetical protein OSB04_025679 [Centaurea solstitialis]|uniref:Uncharacterized protein n=1 Tax=Centaurea solstitialis TaxID=347529 RepID=A0AA38W477_9ASTR|nr:hypothetical protein OSB04_025679 [Centaurea solstitialis]
MAIPTDDSADGDSGDDDDSGIPATAVAIPATVWVAYKESSRFSAFFWIILLICFGSIATCVYIVRELFYLSPHQHISLIIFSKSDRQVLQSP